MTTIVSILQNLGLLSIGAISLLLLTRHFNLLAEHRQRRILFGLVLGTISVIVVGVPIQGPLGSSFDTRAAPLVLAGYFAGPLGGMVAACLAAIARYKVGGPAVIGGVASVFIYAIAGALFAVAARHRRHFRLGLRGFAVLGIAATMAVLPAFFIGQPVSTGLAILERFWWILLIGNVVGVTLLGLTIEFLMEISDAHDRYAVELETSRIARREARIGVWSHDLESDRMIWDAIHHDLMGVDSDAFDGTPLAFVDRVLPSDRPAVEDVLLAAKARPGPFQMRFRIRTPNGEIRHVRSHGNSIGDDDTGKPRRVIGVNMDVTREDALMAQVNLNSAALDSAVCGVTIAEAGGGRPIVYVNRAFTEITGYQAEEVLGQNCRFLNQGLEGQPELEHIRRSLARGTPCSVTLRNRRKNGSLFWNALRLSPIHDKDGAVTHFIGVQDDVTEQVMARQMIADGRDQLQAIVTAVPDAILSVDSSQKIVSFNTAAVRLFGWTGEEAIGRSIHELVPIPVRDTHVELVRNYITDPNAAAGPMSSLRIVQARRKDGTTFPALISLARYQFGGEPMVTATAHDMSDIVDANDELQRLSIKLSEQLAEAHRANEAKDHFLAHMSHELRTPLNAIIGFADLVATLGAERLGPERTAEYVSDIQRSGEHLLSLINDILDLSKLQAGRIEPSIAAEDASGLIVEAVKTVRPVFSERGIQVVVETGEPLAVLCGRRLALQCLLNLLSNAAKYAPTGSRVIARSLRVDLGVRFTIEDEGTGVPDDILERVGEPFLRHDDALTANGEGSGLGLAITKQLAEKQGGQLQIARGERGGTVASIWLPGETPALVEDEARLRMR